MWNLEALATLRVRPERLQIGLKAGQVPVYSVVFPFIWGKYRLTCLTAPPAGLADYSL